VAETEPLLFASFGSDSAASQVGVWRIEVRPDYRPDNDIAVLDDLERSRAACFRTEALRNVYVAAHSGLRRILAAHLDVRAKDLVFGFNDWGKASLRDPGTELEFNLSHSSNRVLIAVSSAGPVGIDVEKILPEPPFEIAPVTFSRNERARLAALSPALRRVAFYDLWSRKEALIKGVGRGFDLNLQDIDVSVDMDVCRSAASLSGTLAQAGDWHLFRLPSIAGFSAALAARQNLVGVHPWEPAVDGKMKIQGDKKLDLNTPLH